MLKRLWKCLTAYAHNAFDLKRIMYKQKKNKQKRELLLVGDIEIETELEEHVIRVKTSQKNSWFCDMLVSISPVYREEVLAWHLKDARLRHCHVYLRLFARASVSKGTRVRIIN